jgi:hypothetical protein
VADVDGDGRDEIVYGAMTIDDNGAGLYSTRLGHGDALHVGDLVPSRAGLEVWDIHEQSNQPSADLHNARTRQIIWARPNNGGVEEVIWRTSDNTALRIYSTPTPTTRRLYILMHDAQYRVAIAWQNTAYNQPPHPSFFLGDGMAQPPPPLVFTP